MEPFGLQNLNYTRFGAPFVRNQGPKTEKKKVSEKWSKKVTPETRGGARVLGIGGGVPYKDPEIRPSERGKPYGHSSCALRARWRILATVGCCIGVAKPRAAPYKRQVVSLGRLGFYVPHTKLIESSSVFCFGECLLEEAIDP